MPRKGKLREVDYTFNEFLDKINEHSETEFKRKNATDAIRKICSMYDISLDDFKADPDDERSAFFLTPDLVEILSILVRNLYLHPLFRSNTDISKIKASDIQQYYEAVIYDIDHVLSPTLRSVIYSSEPFFSSAKIAYWMNPFLQEFTHLFYNMINLKNQELGSALGNFTTQMDIINYNLFQGDRALQLLSGNAANVKIDSVLVYCLKWSLNKINFFRYSDFIVNPEIERLSSSKEYREQYIEFIVKSDTELMTKYMMNKEAKERAQARCNEWISIRSEINDNNFNPSKLRAVEPILSNEDRIKVLENEIKIREQMLELDRANIQALKMGDKPLVANEYHGADVHPRRYLEHCEEIDKNSNELYDAVDNFIGRVMYQFLK